MRVWSYVITTDGGGAPNYDGPAVTLTICKPYIRRHARPGDMVLAFNGRTLSRNPHSVRWAGIVSEVVPLDHYWDDPRFRAKRPDRSDTPDNIYRLLDGQWFQVPNNSHDLDSLKNDTSGKNALIFSRVWHLGELEPELPEIFDLRVIARRNEPDFRIEPDEQHQLMRWLDDHHCGLPKPRKSSRCRPRPRMQGVPSTC